MDGVGPGSGNAGFVYWELKYEQQPWPWSSQADNALSGSPFQYNNFIVT